MIPSTTDRPSTDAFRRRRPTRRRKSAELGLSCTQPLQRNAPTPPRATDPDQARWSSKRPDHRPAAMIAALATLLTGLLLTCSAPRALEGDDEQPMLIEADKVELDEAQSTSVYAGNVQADQGSMRLLADHVTVYHRDDRRVRYLIALGEPAHYRQMLDNDDGEVLAWAQRMDYDADKDELILIGDALLVQGEDRISSERIIYDRARERMRAGGSGRVKIRITPEKEDDELAPGGAQPEAKQPAALSQPAGPAQPGEPPQ